MFDAFKRFRIEPHEEVRDLPSQFHPVREAWIRDFAQNFGHPPVLVELFWRDVGFGPFRADWGGNVRTNLSNFFLAPPEVGTNLKSWKYQKLFFEGAPLFPFLEALPGANFCIAWPGVIVGDWAPRSPISLDIGSFCRRMAEDPDAFAAIVPGVEPWEGLRAVA